MKRKQTKGKIEKANVHLTTDNDIKKEWTAPLRLDRLG